MFEGKGLNLFGVWALTFFILLNSATVCAGKRYKKVKGGVGTLLELSRSRKEMKEVYEDETESFENVREAFKENRLKTGTPASEVVKEYGPPVVEVPADSPGQTRWIYKRSGSDFFTGEKMNLYFDRTGGLVNAEHIEAEKSESPDKE